MKPCCYGTKDNPVSYTHLDVYKRQALNQEQFASLWSSLASIILDRIVTIKTDRKGYKIYNL